MAVVNSASALGEAIGKIIEDEIERTLNPLCIEKGYYFDRGGARPEKRKGVKLQMVNKSGNFYQLDGVVETPDDKPIIIIESKYLRYKKHNRDKASWTCSAHYSLRKSYPSIRKSIAILSGNWSLPSKKFMESFGIELYEISFDHICKVLERYNIEFNWSEKDRNTPDKSWLSFQKLDSQSKNNIGTLLLNPIRNKLVQSVKFTLESGEDWAKRIQELELLLRTDKNEHFTYSFTTIKQVIQFLLDLQVDDPDLPQRL